MLDALDEEGLEMGGDLLGRQFRARQKWGAAVG